MPARGRQRSPRPTRSTAHWCIPPSKRCRLQVLLPGQSSIAPKASGWMTDRLANGKRRPLLCPGRRRRFGWCRRFRGRGSRVGRLLVFGERRLAGDGQLRAMLRHAFAAGLRILDHAARKLSRIGPAGFANRSGGSRSRREVGAVMAIAITTLRSLFIDRLPFTVATSARRRKHKRAETVANCQCMRSVGSPNITSNPR